MKKTLLIFGMLILSLVVVAQREEVLYHGWTGIVAERKLVNANGIKCGYDKIYNTEGVLVEMYTYKNGEKNGPCESYSPYTGQVLSRGNFTAGERSGVWTSYNTDKGVPKDTPEMRLTYPSRNPKIIEKTFEEEESYYNQNRILVKHEKWCFFQGKNVLTYLRTKDIDKAWSCQGTLIYERRIINDSTINKCSYWDNGKLKNRETLSDTCFSYDINGNRVEAYFLKNFSQGGRDNSRDIYYLPSGKPSIQLINDTLFEFGTRTENMGELIRKEYDSLGFKVKMTVNKERGSEYKTKTVTNITTGTCIFKEIHNPGQWRIMELLDNGNITVESKININTGKIEESDTTDHVFEALYEEFIGKYEMGKWTFKVLAPIGFKGKGTSSSPFRLNIELEKNDPNFSRSSPGNSVNVYYTDRYYLKLVPPCRTSRTFINLDERVFESTKIEFIIDSIGKVERAICTDLFIKGTYDAKKISVD